MDGTIEKTKRGLEAAGRGFLEELFTSVEDRLRYESPTYVRLVERSRADVTVFRDAATDSVSIRLIINAHLEAPKDPMRPSFDEDPYPDPTRTEFRRFQQRFHYECILDGMDIVRWGDTAAVAVATEHMKRAARELEPYLAAATNHATRELLGHTRPRENPPGPSKVTQETTQPDPVPEGFGSW